MKDVVELEDYLDEKLGPASRRVAYGSLLPDPRLRSLLGKDTPAWEAAFSKVASGALVALIRTGLKVTPEGVARSRKVLDEVFERIDSLLADGRSYLCGGVFTAADLTLASLALPVIFPPWYARQATPEEDLPGELRALIAQYRARPTGKHVLKLYEQHRE